MSERYQVNIRLDRELVEEIDRLADEGSIDRSEMARRLLSTGLAGIRMRRALDDYRSGNVTAWRAAGIAGVSLYEMLDRIHEEGVPHDLDPTVLGRVGTLVGAGRAVHQDPAPYEATSGARLRAQFEPERVSILFVGESSPAGGTHFYRADSNLFRATREAFAVAFGEEQVADGPRFLREFQDRGCWLVDLVDHPVNQLTGEEREALASGGVAELARTIEKVQPARLVAVKATIDDEVISAARVAGSTADLLALPFPVRQWRTVFVRELAAALRRWSED